MTPETIQVVTAISSLLDKVGTLPIGTVIMAVIVGPYVVNLTLGYRQAQQFKAMKDMYENNVKLVKDYEKMSNEHVETIRLSTGAITELTTFLKTRTPCHQFINTSIAAMRRTENEPAKRTATHE